MYPTLPYPELLVPAEYMGKPVVGIAQNAFYKLDSAGKKIDNYAKRIVLPPSVKYIEFRAFYALTYLEEVCFDGESKLEEIGKEGFAMCESLTDIVLPDTLAVLENECFRYCRKLSVINLPPKLTKLPAEAFRETALKEVDLQYVTEIGSQAFQSCRSLVTVKNPQNITALVANAFNQTAWYAAEEGRAAASATEKYLMYLGNALLLCAQPSGAIDVIVPPRTTVIANNAFPLSLSNGFIRFLTEIPPKINNFAVSSLNIDILVPQNALSAYLKEWGTKLGTNTPERIYYEDSSPSFPMGLTVFANKPTGSTTYLILFKYIGSESTLSLWDVFEEKYDGNVAIRKIKTGAFSNLPNLQMVILPPKILLIETNAFNHLYAFKSVRLQGEWGSHVPVAAQLANGCFTPMIPASLWNIQVPQNRLSDYEKNWKLYEEQLVGY
jgi:hypothetical protein